MCGTIPSLVCSSDLGSTKSSKKFVVLFHDTIKIYTKRSDIKPVKEINITKGSVLQPKSGALNSKTNRGGGGGGGGERGGGVASGDIDSISVIHFAECGDEGQIVHFFFPISLPLPIGQE